MIKAGLGNLMVESELTTDIGTMQGAWPSLEKA